MGRRSYRGGTDPFPRDDQNRARIAQVAARLIAEHGLNDWSLAKRKAVRQLMLPDREPLPGDDEVEAALIEHQALFGGEAHEASLRAQREHALRWMRRLAAFQPMLIGGVAAGWASEHSDVRIELVADDPKTVELTLINADVAYRTPSPSGDDEVAHLHIDAPQGGVRLIVRSAHAARQRPRRDRNGQPEVRLDAAAVERMLEGSGDRA